MPVTFIVTRQRSVESLGQQHSLEQMPGQHQLRNPGFFSSGGFVRGLANQTRLSFQTVAEILRQMPEDKFRQICTNEHPALSAYADPLMPVDSAIERDTVDESQLESVTVFAKLPRINIPTPLGKKYNPDFGYAVHRQGDAKALYLVVETKGYQNRGGIEGEERFKIDSAKKFFDALKAEGVPVEFVTKVNGEKLGNLVAEILQT